MGITSEQAEQLRLLIVKTHMADKFNKFLAAEDELQQFIDDITEE